MNSKFTFVAGVFVGYFVLGRVMTEVLGLMNRNK